MACLSMKKLRLGELPGHAAWPTSREQIRTPGPEIRFELQDLMLSCLRPDGILSLTSGPSSRPPHSPLGGLPPSTRGAPGLRTRHCTPLSSLCAPCPLLGTDEHLPSIFLPKHPLTALQKEKALKVWVIRPVRGPSLETETLAQSPSESAGC